jgi:hypothetical protein
MTGIHPGQLSAAAGLAGKPENAFFVAGQLSFGSGIGMGRPRRFRFGCRISHREIDWRERQPFSLAAN